MSSRNRAAWERPPDLPPTHYVDAAAYSDPGIFADEMDRIMARSWRFGCHESELAAAYDFRTLDHAELPLVMIRGGDGRIRTFYNVCPHRGARLFNDLSGQRPAQDLLLPPLDVRLAGQLRRPAAPQAL